MATTTIQPSSNHLHLFHQTTNPNSKPLIFDQNTVTPPPLIKKRGYCCSSSSVSYSSSTYGTCSSSSPPISPSSLSSPSPSSQFSLLRCTSTPQPHSANTNTNTNANNQPLFLRRTVSDPPIYSSDSSNEDTSSNKRMKKILQELGASPSQSVHRNAMGLLLPPLPPPPSPKLLRRTVSDHGNNEKEKRQEQLVKTEKLSGDWTMIKLKCGCGSDFQFLFCAADSKCYKLV
uniref:Uncharacterized protein n=1 Tax=Chenopodium quinoa TaxID=63459 RepID=A0A803LW15_CHEQI